MFHYFQRSSNTYIYYAFNALLFYLHYISIFDTDHLPIHSEPRVVFDAQQNDFFFGGETTAIVYLRTNAQTSVCDSDFLDALSLFQDEAILEVSSKANVAISGILSMISLGTIGYSLQEYKHIYANPTSDLYINITSQLVDPLYLTDLTHNTFIQFAIPDYHYSTAAKQTTRTLRNMLNTGNYFQGMLDYEGVGGPAALCIDEYDSLSERLPISLAITFVSVYVILLLMTKSVLLPLKAVIMSVLSLGATFGIIVLLFFSTNKDINDAFGFVPTGYVDGTNLIFIFSVAFGLSVDYEVFLLSRMLEEYKKSNDITYSMLNAMQSTGSIITSAAIMLSVTTFSFMIAKLYFLKILGVGIGIAVVLDATLVRMVFVPATVNLLGEYNMYCPEWLGKIVDFVGLQECDDDGDDGDDVNI